MSNATNMTPTAVEIQDNFTNIYSYTAEQLIYIGRAKIGSATSAAVWQIKKVTYDSAGDVTNIQNAGGDQLFDNIWDNRTGDSYS